jgi:hypothetical protein
MKLGARAVVGVVLCVVAGVLSTPSRAALSLVAGTNDQGEPRNPPAQWPTNAGAWNAKGAQYNVATRRLAFESFREDICGGSVVPEPGVITAPGVDRYFLAGSSSATGSVSGTTVIYIAGRDGENPRPIGDTDIADGVGGAEIYAAVPSTSGVAHAATRQTGAVIYAHQNKDLPAWHPDGGWLFAAVEMPRHALTHDSGNGEKGMFCNLWAISEDGKIWVQLTAYESTWPYFDPVAMTPYANADTNHCPTAWQYVTASNPHPFYAYSACASNAPPPASGIMRPVTANAVRDGATPIVWAERVGLSPYYAWGGVLQLAMADVVFVDGLPALVNYRRNLAPTPAAPDGRGLWAGHTVIGAGYEAWCFSKDDSEILFASDVCLSVSTSGIERTISPSSQKFTDVVAWRWRSPCALRNLTAWDANLYAYENNAAPPPTRYYGHWEEPAVFLLSELHSNDFVFASSAAILPTWNPNNMTTLGLDTWLGPRGTNAARRLTTYNASGKPRTWAYPTSTDPADDSVYLSVVPGIGGVNPPGNLYRLTRVVNHPPLILQLAPAGPVFIEVGVTQLFSVVAADVDSDPLAYVWACGDGDSGTGTNLQHAWIAPGAYSLQLIVSDGEYAATGAVSVLALDASADDNSDGLPDLWQFRMFGSTNAPGARPSDDPDGDGLNNFGEWKAGTDPTNVMSVLRVSRVESLGAEIVIAWPSVAGRHYAIDGSTNLPLGFPDSVVTGIPATAILNTKTVQVDQACQRFFRVRVE